MERDTEKKQLKIIADMFRCEVDELTREDVAVDLGVGAPIVFSTFGAPHESGPESVPEPVPKSAPESKRFVGDCVRDCDAQVLETEHVATATDGQPSES